MSVTVTDRIVLVKSEDEEVLFHNGLTISSATRFPACALPRGHEEPTYAVYVEEGLTHQEWWQRAWSAAVRLIRWR